MMKSNHLPVRATSDAESRVVPLEPSLRRSTARVSATRPEFLLAVMLGCALMEAAATSAQSIKPPTLDRDRLMEYVDTDGVVRPVTNESQWSSRRRRIVAAMESLMGKLPAPKQRPPVPMRIDESVDCGSYMRRHISYESETGNWVPAYLSIPKRALEGERVPAMLCLHPTDNRVGNKVVVGLGGRPNRQYAQELAERGYVTLAPAYPLLADYQPDWRKLGYESGTMKAIWDNMRGVDLLSQFEFVDSSRIGAIGHSLGGHNSVYTAVFDSRIRVVVTSCGLDRYRDYKQGDIRGWTSDRYMPKLLAYRDRLPEIPVDFPEIIAALAPRPVLIIAPIHDSNFLWQSVDRIVESARPVYALLGKPDNLRVVHPDCAHDFPPEMRRLAYQWIDRALKPGLRDREEVDSASDRKSGRH